MAVVAWAAERLVLRKLVNQEGIILFMATIGITFFLEGLAQTVFGADVYPLNIGLPKEPIFILESLFDGGILVNELDIWAAVIAGLLVARAGAVLPAHRASAAPCAPSPTTMPRRSRSASRSTRSGSSSGWSPAWWRWSPARCGAASSACSSRSRCWR